MLYLFSLMWLSCLSGASSQLTLEFSIQPTSVIVREGSPAILHCQTKQTSKDIFIMWKKGSKWILDYGGKSYSKLSNNSLYFPSIGKDDEVNYICAAKILNTKKIIYSKVAHITLAYINSTFIRAPSDQTVREFSQVFFSCISGPSQPLPNVTWEKDGQPIADKGATAQNYLRDISATSGSLQLNNVSLADAGYYRCVAVNPLLPNQHRLSLQALLLVLPKDDKPRIEVHPVNTMSPKDKPLHMHCVIVGVPAPVIIWEHNGRRVVNSSDGSRQVYLNGTLSIKSLARDDRGNYSCNGTNDKGSIESSKIFLSVAYLKYNFTKNPMNKTVVNGTRVEMECKPPDHHPNRITYKWYKNYRAMAMGGRWRVSLSGSLIFNPVLKSDGGVYFCEVTNPFSHQTVSSTEGYLTVHVPPYFLSTPSSQSIVLYEQLHLSCVSQGSPQPVVLWYHRNRLLSNTSGLSLGADGSLTLTAVETSDSGEYKCFISNIAGNKTSVATIIVHVPPNATVIPRNTSVVLGNNVSFFCQFGGNPPPSVYWTFSQNGQSSTLLPKNSTRFIQTEKQLYILNASEQDKGWFICVGGNVAGLQNFSAYLDVFVPAYLTRSLRNTTVNQSDTVNMTCSGYGNPEPAISWWKNGRLLVPNDNTILIGGRLQLKNVSRNNSGVYSCTARNEFGNQTSSAYLTVQVPPTIHSVFGPPRTRWKSNVSLQCQFDGVPKPLIAWLKDGHSIAYNGRIFGKVDRLFITSTAHNDTGNYTCVASNIVGSSRLAKQLIVEVLPYPPRNLQSKNISSTSLRVRWQSAFDGNNPIVSFRVEIKTISSSWENVSDSIVSQEFLIKHLLPYTWYHVRVFAKNMIGWSEASESITVLTGEDSPSSPVNLTCATHNATAVSLSWGKPSQPNGVLGNYSVERGNLSQRPVLCSNLHCIVHNLEIFTVYKFRVRASTRNSSLWGNYTSYVRCRSGEAAPVAPENVTLKAVRSDTILAKWQLIPVGSANGIVRSYSIRYKNVSEKNYTEENIKGNQTSEYNISGLVPWTEYAVQVSAVTVDRGPWSTERRSRTLESAPSGPPIIIVAKGNTSRSLFISWRPPSMAERHGIVIRYMIFYKEHDPLASYNNVTTNETSVYLSGLSIFTRYVLKIKASTSVGYGELSERTIAMTLESYPGPVGNVTKNITVDSIWVRWNEPDTPNGNIIAYRVHYNTSITIRIKLPGSNMTITNITTQIRNITTNVTTVILSGIHGNVTYSLCVSARTSVGYGECSSRITFTTNFTLPPTPKPTRNPAVFTPSIIDDHLPLIAAGATIFVVMLIALFTCWMVRRKKNKNKEEQAKRTLNFRGHAFSMDSYDDGESSVVSHGSKPINGYSMDTGSLPSRTNTSNVYESRQSESHSKPTFVRLRNNSLNLGSDASSYDDAYSSVAEIGLDPENVDTISPSTTQHGPDHAQIHSAANPLFPLVQNSAGDNSDNSSLDSYCAVNPIYAPPLPHEQPSAGAWDAQEVNGDVGNETRPPDERTGQDTSPAFSSDLPKYMTEDDEHVSSADNDNEPFNPYGILVLPPPPPQFSDFTGNHYSVPESHEGYHNEVTDF